MQRVELGWPRTTAKTYGTTRYSSESNKGIQLHPTGLSTLLLSLSLHLPQNCLRPQTTPFIHGSHLLLEGLHFTRNIRSQEKE